MQYDPEQTKVESVKNAENHDTPGAHANHAPHSHDHGAFPNADLMKRALDDPERDAWQQPDRVVDALGLAPGMTVADVGAGTGYFAVRLARALPQGEVIATDIAPDMVRHLTARAARENLTNLRPVLATENNTGLPAGGVDRILVVHVWHHVADRRHFAESLRPALVDGGKLFIVDFVPGAKRGPSPQMRLRPEVVVEELQDVGFSARWSFTSLPHQYIIVAERCPAPSGEHQQQ